MDGHVYFSLRDDYGFQPLNTPRGLEITSTEDPEASYILPSGEVNFYSYSPSLMDLVHPFRPSGKIIAEVNYPDDGSDFRMYLSGSEQQFQELDREIMNILEQLDSPEYFKKIL